MYVAHTGADRVEVVDCSKREFLHSIDDLKGVAGVLVDSQRDLLMTSDRGAARVSIFRCSDEGLLGQVEVGPHPNGLAYDHKRHRLFSFNLGEPLGESCTASVVDVDSLTVAEELPLPGRPRWAAYDEASDLIYLNIREPALILRIDPEKAMIESAIEVPIEGPHGLWVDGTRLYCAADGGALLVIDCDDGQTLAMLELPGSPDVVWHNPRDHELYIAVGDPGSVTLVDTATLDLVETITTEPGAHTLAWDPVGETLYVFCPASGGAALYTRQDAGS
jgi:DNA-binding beta-propeller fold protein YncE